MKTEVRGHDLCGEYHHELVLSEGKTLTGTERQRDGQTDGKRSSKTRSICTRVDRQIDRETQSLIKTNTIDTCTQEFTGIVDVEMFYCLD